MIRKVFHDELHIDTAALCGVVEYACGLLVGSISCTKPTVRAVDMSRKAVLPGLH
jgi:hypothetical protein